MRCLLSILLCCILLTAHASEHDLLARALTCELQDEELPSLLKTLASQRSDFKRPAGRWFGDSAGDVYQLAAPITAYGHTSLQVVITAGRVLLADSGLTFADDVNALRLELEKASYFRAAAQARRVVRPTVSIVAYQLHTHTSKMMLIGCEYANQGAAQWLEDFKMPGTPPKPN
jgi:hypothetical protein